MVPGLNAVGDQGMLQSKPIPSTCESQAAVVEACDVRFWVCRDAFDVQFSELGKQDPIVSHTCFSSMQSPQRGAPRLPRTVHAVLYVFGRRVLSMRE